MGLNIKLTLIRVWFNASRNICNTKNFKDNVTEYTWYDMIYLSTAIGLTPGGSSTVHIYTQTIHRTQWDRIHRTEHT